MKKLITTLTALLLTVIFCIPALAYDVTVEGAEQHPFGKPTSTDTVSVTPADVATITDKDAQLIAPAFGSASAYAPGTGEPLTPHLTGTAAGTPPSGGNATTHVPTTNSPAVPETLFTLPQFYSDGSMGRLQIPRIGVDAKIYETESLDSLAKGIGHFKTTSAWDGLVGLCAHNRGTTTIFAKLHTLQNGDRITYTTPCGTRTYQVYFVGTIDYTDFSRLGRSDTNILTLITCVNNQPTKRVCVQAREV